MKLTVFPSIHCVNITEENRLEISWHELKNRFSSHQLISEKSAAPVFVGAEFVSGGQRRSTDLSNYFLLVLDYDNGIHFNWFISEHQEYEFILYSTHSHSEKQCKFRVILPFQHPVDPITFRKAGPVLRKRFPDADPASFNLSQAFYLPSCAPSTQHLAFVHHNKGRWFSLEGLKLEMVLLEIETMTKAIKRNQKSRVPSTLTEATRLFSKMDPDHPDLDYHAWVKIGMALKGLFGNEAKNLWISWSRSGQSCKQTEKQLNEKWAGFSTKSPYCFGYLVNRSKEFSHAG